MPSPFPHQAPTAPPVLQGLLEDAATAESLESLAEREERFLADISDAIDSLLPESMRRSKTRHRRNPR